MLKNVPIPLRPLNDLRYSFVTITTWFQQQQRFCKQVGELSFESMKKEGESERREEKRRRWGLGIWRKEGKGEKEKKKGIKSNKKKVFHESVPWHRLMPFWNGHCLHMDSLRSWSQDKHHSAKNWCEKWRQGRRAVIQDWGGGCQSKMLPNQLPQWGSWSLGFVWKTHMRVIPPEGEGDGPFITPVYGDHCLIAAPMGS